MQAASGLYVSSSCCLLYLCCMLCHKGPLSCLSLLAAGVPAWQPTGPTKALSSAWLFLSHGIPSHNVLHKPGTGTCILLSLRCEIRLSVFNSQCCSNLLQGALSPLWPRQRACYTLRLIKAGHVGDELLETHDEWFGVRGSHGRWHDVH